MRCLENTSVSINRTSLRVYRWNYTNAADADWMLTVQSTTISNETETSVCTYLPWDTGCSTTHCNADKTWPLDVEAVLRYRTTGTQCRSGRRNCWRIPRRRLLLVPETDCEVPRFGLVRWCAPTISHGADFEFRHSRKSCRDKPSSKQYLCRSLLWSLKQSLRILWQPKRRFPCRALVYESSKSKKGKHSSVDRLSLNYTNKLNQHHVSRVRRVGWIQELNDNKLS